MKTLFLILTLISFNSWAGYVAGSKVNQCNRVDYVSPSDCQELENETCYKVPNDSGECGIFKLVDNLQDDISKPVWATRSMVESCIDEADCKARHEAKQCVDGRVSFYSIDDLEVWCNKIVSYEQIAIGKKLIIDETVKATKDAEKAAKSQMDNALGMVKKRRECGGGVIDLFVLRNAQKGLTKQQVKQLTSTFSPIQDLLLNGSLETAKEEILAATVDGVLITDTDKTALAGAVDKCLGL